MAEEFRVLRPFEYHSQLISKGLRADGRKLDECRDLRIETDAINTADSSSLVKLGRTSLVCGCTAKVTQHEEDLINIRVELPPISSTGHRKFINEQIITKTLKNIIEDTDCLDKSCLHIAELDSYWSINVEVICLNYDGSLVDASLIGIIAALKSLKLKDNPNEMANRTFNMKSNPVCLSFAVIGDYFICDPDLEEEAVAQSVFSITTDSVDKDACHCVKVGGKAINLNKLKKSIELSRKRAHQLGNHVYEMDCS